MSEIHFISVQPTVTVRVKVFFSVSQGACDIIMSGGLMVLGETDRHKQR